MMRRIEDVLRKLIFFAWQSSTRMREYVAIFNVSCQLLVLEYVLVISASKFAYVCKFQHMLHCGTVFSCIAPVTVGVKTALECIIKDFYEGVWTR